MTASPLSHDDPRAVGRYRLTGRLGEGGQGVVYLGEGPSGERVAIKMLKTADAAARGRFAREMGAARRVAAFCTAAVLDSSSDGETPYVVSEFIDGPSLQRRVAEAGPLLGGDLERLAVNTASALAAIHAAGIVHRDLKPANVLLGPDGPRVVDFGIARAIDAATRTQPVGTPAYFAPEWLKDHPPTDKSDVFAWAGTIVYAATGHPPFGRAPSIPATLHRIATGEPDLGGVPASLLPLLTECLDKDPGRRPSARELMVRLVDPSAATGPAPGPDPGARPPHPPASEDPPPSDAGTRLPAGPGPGRRRVRAIAAGGAAVAVIAAGATVLALSDIGDRGTPGGGAAPSASAGTTPPPADAEGAETGAPMVPAAFAGTWRGEVAGEEGDTPGLTPTKATIVLKAGATHGTAHYPGWGCRSTLVVTRESAWSVEFDESSAPTRGGKTVCYSSTLVLRKIMAGLEYRSPGFEDVTGTLRKVG